MFVNTFLIFTFDLVQKIMQNPKAYIIYMYMYVTAALKMHWAELTQAELTQGRLDSGADLTSGRVDPLPCNIVRWLQNIKNFKVKWSTSV